MTSCDGRFTLIQQSDGNLVLYKAGVGALWSMSTQLEGDVATVMKEDGELARLRRRVVGDVVVKDLRIPRRLARRPGRRQFGHLSREGHLEQRHLGGVRGLPLPNVGGLRSPLLAPLLHRLLSTSSRNEVP